MNLFRSTAAVLALTTGLLAMPAHAESVPQNASGDPMYTVEAPKAYSMIGDLVIARPLLIGATVLAPPLSSSACRSPRWAAMSVRRARRWWSSRARQPSYAAWAAPPAATTHRIDRHHPHRDWQALSLPIAVPLQ